MNPTVKYLPEGLPNLQPLFPAVDLSQVEEWYVRAKDSTGAVIATTRTNLIGCCCGAKKYRIHFINSLGEIDSINFGQIEITEEIKSDTWTKTLAFPFDRTKGGSYRHNISSNETVDAETNCYLEKDQFWVKELFETPNAWLEMQMPQGFDTSYTKEYVPIEILDTKFTIRKNDKRYDYLIKVKFSMSNANINLR